MYVMKLEYVFVHNEKISSMIATLYLNRHHDTMSRVIVLFLCLFLNHSRIFADSASSEIILKTGLGSIRGSELRTWKNNVFYGFRGIRFAKPPINELRFKDPVPIESWNDTIFDGTRDGPMCPQPGKNETEYSEDCLRLNVYINKMPCEVGMNLDSCSTTKKPVLLYIHGGGFYVGSGVSSDYGGPYYLLEHDIVLVTFNYRLAFLGLASLGTKDYPGNAGFKDQVLAMRFVRDHIEAFGGDPNRVTLIGNSAGSYSVAMHLISPMSRGLFHQAILGSGGLDFKEPLPTEQITVARSQAKKLNCYHLRLGNMMECLKSKTTKEFVDTVYSSFTIGRAPWEAVVEPDFGQERFFTEQPLYSFEKGDYMRVPMMAGVTQDELVESAVSVVNDPVTSFFLNHAWNIVLPMALAYDGWSIQGFNISKTLREFYHVPSPITAENALDPIGQLISDAYIGFSTFRTAKFMEKFKPVYQYKFSYVGRYSHLYYPDDKPYGAEHSDDFIYLLCRNRTAPIFNEADPEAIIIEYMTRLYTNFVIHGDPNDKTDPYISHINWTPLNDQNRQYLNINATLLIESDMFKDRYALWDELFPIKYP